MQGKTGKATEIKPGKTSQNNQCMARQGKV
jgi:hypothetical protein